MDGSATATSAWSLCSGSALGAAPAEVAESHGAVAAAAAAAHATV